MRIALALFVLCCTAAAQAVNQPTFYARQDYPGNGQVRVADLNGDKIPDVIATSGDQIMTLLGNGDGTFRVGPTTYPGMWIGGLAVVDLNGDGYPDLNTETSRILPYTHKMIPHGCQVVKEPELNARCTSPNQFENFDRNFRQSLTVPKAAVLKEDARWAKKRARKTG
jgi:hypothetical protein